MKKCLLLILSIGFLLSCEKDNLEMNSVSNAPVQTKSSTSDPIDQLTGIPVSIKCKSTSNSNIYLSANNNSKQAELYSEVDNTGRQKWLVQLKGDPANRGSYSIVLLEGGPYANSLLATQNNRTVIGPFITNPTRWWNVDNIPNTNSYRITTSVWQNLGVTKYNLIPENSSSRNLILSTTNSQLNNWEITPIEEFEFVDIKYTMEGKDYTKLTPLDAGSERWHNATPEEAEYTFTLSTVKTETSLFSTTEQMSVTQKFGIKTSVGVPIFANGEINFETTSSNLWEFTESSTITKSSTVTKQLKIKVPPLTKLVVEYTLSQCSMNITYIVTYKGTKTGKLLTLKGKWQGIQGSDLEYKLKNESTGEQLVLPTIKM